MCYIKRYFTGGKEVSKTMFSFLNYCYLLHLLVSSVVSHNTAIEEKVSFRLNSPGKLVVKIWGRRGGIGTKNFMPGMC